MVFGIGVDITDIARIKAARQKNPGFVQRVLTANEQVIFNTLSTKRQAEFLAGRFSAKESFGKALGSGIGKTSFQDIEILDNAIGKPEITLNPFDGNAFVSISHTDTLVMSEVVLEKRLE
ncbi:holo-ACP synthase [Loigolactobacillus backii]|uniref:holo-ACP synthase n=1 Tax=Loigolactobacillus backii TaxID=375175 RepID=UPI0007F060DA|nr:holo-ACP synthase [Loigolactobacillus backii]ANK60234.1 holo-ACP synthase [Loigolactobacillus backii]ANK65116.1 holo-ACP synthase [Loigolactobacillus backii]ANK67675.1 holo-ACP synthase [Loigolactobacillus backii]OLF69386.1 hypothetical protein ACX53_08125 [Loigolactobacillus backii]PIO87099.1 holo-ACP synthase [Loigolactobacillus backii]